MSACERGGESRPRGPQFIIEANRQPDSVKQTAGEPAPLPKRDPAGRWGCEGGHAHCGQGQVCNSLTWAMGYCLAPEKRRGHLMREVVL